MFKPVDPNPNFSKLEEEILKFWEKNKIFEKSLEKTTPTSSPPIRSANRVRKRGSVFTFYDGPPFATGLPHYGHILASTIKDLIPRYQTMKGRYVRRRWGWDCHGLPIEEIVERELKISGKKQIEKIGIKKFNETCRSMVLQYVGEWKKMVRRIARWTEFDNSYKTMDRDYMESVWWAFKEIYDKGLVYEGRKVLLYCPRCETPISNFEVAMDNSYQDVTEEAVTVKFRIKTTPTSSPPILQSKTGGEREGVYLLAWTTTPWTLPGNIALAVGKDIDYVVMEKDGENYIAAKNSPGKGEFKGKDLVGLEYEPLYDIPEMKSDQSYKVYAADFVNTEEGTGIVHTAVVYGEEDYKLGMKVGLPVVPLLDEKGKFNEKSPELLHGAYFKDAEKIIKNDLASRGLLFEKKNHQHSYPHCWRCDSMLYYNAIPAWFVNIQKIKKKLLASNKKEINWYPEHLKLGRYAKSAENAPDWNISRNRYWGNPIPVWKCEKCNKNTVIGSMAELKKKVIHNQSSIIDDRFDPHRPYIDEVILKCGHCGGKAKRITEIFDSWVEAACMPFAEYHFPFTPASSPPIPIGIGTGGEREGVGFPFPAQFVAEYIAQTRAWFYVMHVISVILFGKAPFENVVATGTILAEDGSKMSKSKRNFPDPWEVIEKYGVDSLRFYLMNSVVMQADNLNFSERDLANANRKIVRILWNVYNYFVTYANANPSPLSPATSGEGKGGGGLDQWILARLQELINRVTEHLDSYNTVQATREIERFINDLSTWYLRRSRGRTDQAFHQTLHYVLVELTKVIAPVMPYISEAIFQNLSTPTSSPPSVHLSDWPQNRKLTMKERQLLEDMQAIRKIVEEVHALRAKAGIKLRQKLSRLVIPAKAGIHPRSRSRASMNPRVMPEDDGLLDILKSEINVQEVVFGDKLELDTEITPELKIEGLARELERQIQQFRKESGLKIGEIVDLYYETESDIIKQAFEKVDRNKIYVKNLEYARPPARSVGGTARQGIENGEGKEMEIEDNEVKIQMSKVKNSGQKLKF